MRTVHMLLTQMTRVFWLELISLNRGTQNIASPVRFLFLLLCSSYHFSNSRVWNQKLFEDFFPIGRDWDALCLACVSTCSPGRTGSHSAKSFLESGQRRARTSKRLQPQNVKNTFLTMLDLRNEDVLYLKGDIAFYLGQPCMDKGSIPADLTLDRLSTCSDLCNTLLYPHPHPHSSTVY